MKTFLVILALIATSTLGQNVSDDVAMTLTSWRQWLADHTSRQLEYVCIDESGGPADGVTVREGLKEHGTDKRWYYEQTRRGDDIPTFIGFQKGDAISVFFPRTGKIAEALEIPLPLSTHSETSFIDRLLENSSAHSTKTEDGNRILTLAPTGDACPSLIQEMFLLWPEAGVIPGPISLVFRPDGALHEMIQYVYKDGSSYQRNVKVTLSEITSKTKAPWIPKIHTMESLPKISFVEGALETLILEKSLDEVQKGAGRETSSSGR